MNKMVKLQMMTIGFALQLAGVAVAQPIVVDRNQLRFNGWSEELVLFSGPIHFDSCSPHSPQHTLTADQDLSLRIDTTTYYGACTSRKVFDFQTADIRMVPVSGPNCPVACADALPVIVGVADADYPQQLDELISFLKPIALGQACHPAHAELGSVVGYLEYLRTAAQPSPREQVAFSGEIRFDSCSHHSPQHTIQVGRMSHVAGEGTVLSIRTTTLYGRCTSEQIFDFDTHALILVSAYGPDCYQGLPMNPSVLSPADPAYRAELQQIRDFLQTVAAGQACHAAAPQLLPSLGVLDQLLRG